MAMGRKDASAYKPFQGLFRAISINCSIHFFRHFGGSQLIIMDPSAFFAVLFFEVLKNMGESLAVLATYLMEIALPIFDAPFELRTLLAVLVVMLSLGVFSAAAFALRLFFALSLTSFAGTAGKLMGSMELFHVSSCHVI